MPSLGMEGPYRLNFDTIDKKVNRVSSGNYAIGRRSKNGIFLFRVIGRANKDLNSKLKSWLDKTDKPLFKFRFSESAREAFEKECTIYHDFVKDKKIKHPRRPTKSDWKCPRCKFYK